MFRIGHGYDIHRFDVHSDHAQITLGGVKIAYDKAIIAHSDGDVVIHAICDAILGALALGDIGHFYPDTSPEFKDYNSRLLLQDVMKKCVLNNYQINNLDVTIIAESPKMAPFIMQMKENIASDLKTSMNQVNVKATTHEKLDAIGNKLGIAVHAVVLLGKQ